MTDFIYLNSVSNFLDSGLFCFDLVWFALAIQKPLASIPKLNIRIVSLQCCFPIGCRHIFVMKNSRNAAAAIAHIEWSFFLKVCELEPEVSG